jgi:UDP-GlcNAc:undecaprenyl-phosphate GlcNAc-1-phosphate transferase
MALYCLLFIASIVVSCLVTWCIRNLSSRYGWASGYISSHHTHTRPVSRLGGVAVFLTFFGLLGAYLVVSRFAQGRLNGDVLKLLLPACCLFATGLIDDLRGLSAMAKLLGQIVGGICLYVSGLRLLYTPLTHSTSSVGAAISLAATVLWVVLICNAINLIDGLDGLAAGVALLSSVTILTFAAAGGMTAIAVATLILAGTLAGFLVFNFYPASIFLGDSGSLFVGLLLSGLVLGLSRRQESVQNAVMMPVFCFALPLTETAISVLRRLLGRRSLFRADREHIHHKLLDLGFTHRQAVWILYGASAICMVLSLVLLDRSRYLMILASAALLALLFFGVRKLGYQEFAEFRRIWKPVWVQNEIRVQNTGSWRDPARRDDLQRAANPSRKSVAPVRIEAPNLERVPTVTDDEQGHQAVGRRETSISAV